MPQNTQNKSNAPIAAAVSRLVNSVLCPAIAEWEVTEEALRAAPEPLLRAHKSAFALFLRAQTDSEEEARLADILTNLATLARDLYIGKDEDGDEN